MNRIASVFALSLLIFLASAFVAGAKRAEQRQPSTAASCNTLKSPYQNGEKATYKIYYNWKAMWMSAGAVTFEVQDAQICDKNVHKVLCEGKTFPKFDWFYKVRDRYETYIDPTTKLPLKFLKDIKEGSYSQENMYTFYHDRSEAMVNYYKRKGKLRFENQTYDITTCSQDLLSAIYYSRCMDYSHLKKGEKLNIDIFLDQKTYNIGLTYLGKETLDTDLGKFKCAKFSPQLLSGDIFKDGDQMTVWVTDDENRVPLMIESPLVVGSVKCYLTDISGLKNPQTSKITE